MSTPYTQDEKSTGLDQLTSLDVGDLIIVGDISDGGFAKTITQANFVISVTSSLDLSTISGQIDLSTQVTGTLPIANGGTGEALTDPADDVLMGWDNTDNAITFITIGTGLSYGKSVV